MDLFPMAWQSEVGLPSVIPLAGVFTTTSYSVLSIAAVSLEFQVLDLVILLVSV